MCGRGAVRKKMMLRYRGSLGAVGACLVLVLTGCQMLFHDQDALLKGKTVSVAMTVPETPLPAVQPLQPRQDQPQAVQPKQALDSSLLPKQDGAVTDSSLALAAKPHQPRVTRVQLTTADTVLVEKTITEDTVLRGTVLVKGSLVIAPQATLRIEAGTVVRFAGDTAANLLPRLVVQGRLVVSGTALKPVLLSSALADVVAGDWGGVVLLNSEKKNSLEHCRIEGAHTGVAAHYSQFSGRGLQISQAQEGVALYDSEASLQGAVLSRCGLAIRLADSELDLKDSTLRENRLGLVAKRSSFTMTNDKVLNNSQEGVVTEQSRFRISNSLFAENRSGARFVEGDGQIFLCSFQQNRVNGVEVRGARIKLRNSSFSRNAGVGLLLDDARGMLTGSVLNGNGGGNLKSVGQEPFAAELNWWGSADAAVVAAGILESRQTGDGSSLVSVSPFLKERPATAPNL